MSKKPRHTKPCHCCAGTGAERDNHRIGKSFRQARILRGIGLRELARRLGVSHAFLHQLENGRRNWTKTIYAKYHDEVIA